MSRSRMRNAAGDGGIGRGHLRGVLVACALAVALVGVPFGLLAARPTTPPVSALAAADTEAPRLSLLPPDAGTLWAADTEEGSLEDWEIREVGGEFNSGIADSRPSRDVAYNGLWSTNLTITTPPESGTRLFRWGESRTNRDLYYEAWFYFPQLYRLTGDPQTGHYLDIFQFKSKSEDGSRNDVIWFLSINNGADGEMIPELVWQQATLEGPHQEELGYHRYVNDDVTFPVGRWFQIRARLRQSNSFDGILQFWLDGQQIFDMQNVRTGYVNCIYNSWCVDQHWSVNLYSDGLHPSPSDIYVDAARIRRVPHSP
jgi:hypothetical protein